MAACLAALFEISLVVFLGAPESLRRLDLGHNALRHEASLCGKLLNLGERLRLLLGRVEEDGRAVLRAPVGPLTVQGGWVVERKERVQQLLVAPQLGIEVEFDYFGVPGLVRANVLVTGPLRLAALIAHRCCCHAGDGRTPRLDSHATK